MTDRRRFELPHGIELDALVAGREDAPVVVFLHGFPEAAFIWEPLLAHFSGRYLCVAPDLRGFGASSAPPEVAAYRAKPLMQDIEALIAAVTGGRPAHLAALVAHDWGGAIAWNLAMRRPELLGRLVIVNSPHPGPFLRDLLHDPAQQAASAYMNFLCRPDAAELLAADDFARLFGFSSAWAARPGSRPLWSSATGRCGHADSTRC
jgi:pimeloyl-ACP methyl ester carboxylesterase